MYRLKNEKGKYMNFVTSIKKGATFGLLTLFEFFDRELISVVL